VPNRYPGELLMVYLQIQHRTTRLVTPAIAGGISGFGWCCALACGRVSSSFPKCTLSQTVGQLVQTDVSTVPKVSSDPRSLPSGQIVILAALLLWLYGPTLGGLAKQWWKDPNFSHGFFVPLFSIFVLWRDRARLRRLVARPSNTGLVVLAFALLVFIVGQLGAELFLSRFSLLLVLAALIVLFRGWNFFRAVLFPWLFLILMIPIPAIIFNQITFPLQLLASRLAAATLPLLGVPVLREGNVIHLPSLALEVAEACSGIRSLMSLITLAIIYGFLTEKYIGVRWLLVLVSVLVGTSIGSWVGGFFGSFVAALSPSRPGAPCRYS